jgi:hypothetical protein
MDFDPALMSSIERLGYQVTVGDVAANAGIEINQAQKGLLALASQTQGDLLVSETGDIVYKFPHNFRSILTNRYWQLRFKEYLRAIWKAVFYIIRISFGIALLLSIALMSIAVVLIMIAASSTQDNDNNGSFGGREGGSVIFWGNPFDSFWLFEPNYNRKNPSRKMNFLESVFSFLFGDGDPNADLEQRRWNTIATVIRNNRGSVIAEQLAPYLDNIKDIENDNYVIPVLSKFNGYPEVSPTGEIIYYFPELQVTTKNHSQSAISNYLEESKWQFTKASPEQVTLSVGLGSLNVALSFILGSLLKGSAAVKLGAFILFIASIYHGLIFYAAAFFAIPIMRYFALKRRNNNLEKRNTERQNLSNWLTQNLEKLQSKMLYASQYSQEKVIKAEDISYSTETDLLEQQWQKRLNQS